MFHVAVILLLCLRVSFAFAAGNESVNPVVPVPFNSSMPNTLKTWQQREIAAISGRLIPTGWVYSGGIHATAGSTTSAAFATEAFTNLGNRVTANSAGGTASINYAAAGCAASDTAWVIISAATANDLANFHRVSTSNYFVDCTSSAEPALPADSAWLMQVIISGSAITAVTDKRIPASFARAGIYDATDPLYGAVGDGVTNNTTALRAWLAAVPAYGSAYLPRGIYQTDPLTVTRPIRPFGQFGTTNAGGSVLQARGDQTHVLAFVGGVGDFDPATFLGGVSLDTLTLDGQGHTISDGLLVLKNAGGALSQIHKCGIINAVGRGVFFHDVQDVVIFNNFFSSLGDNGGTPALEADGASTNNTNNIRFIANRFENWRWTVWKQSNSSDDQIVFISNKFEGRPNPDGPTLSNLAFRLIDVTGGARFTMLQNEFTATNYFTLPSIRLINTIQSYIHGTNVFNVNGVQTSAIISIEGVSQSYDIGLVQGFQVGPISNIATKQGQWQGTVLDQSNTQAARLNRLDANMQLPDQMQVNGGGAIAVGQSGSITGRSLAMSTSTDTVIGALVATGFQTPARVDFRVSSSGASTPVSVWYRDRAGTNTLLQGGITIGTSWTIVSAYLTVAQLAAADTVVMSRDSGSNTVFGDSVYIEYGVLDVGMPTTAVTTSSVQLGRYSNASLYYIRAVSLSGSILVSLDSNTATVSIINQQGTTFVANALPGTNQIGLNASTVNGAGERYLSAIANSGTPTVAFRQITAH